MNKQTIINKNLLKNEFDDLIQNKKIKLLRRDECITFSLELYATNDYKYYTRINSSEAKSIKNEKEYFLKLNLMMMFEKIYSFRDMSKEQIGIFKIDVDNRVMCFCKRNNINKDSLKIGLIKNEIQFLFSDPFKYYYEYVSVIYKMNIKEYPSLKILENGSDNNILIMSNEHNKDISPFDILNKIYEAFILKKFPNYYYFH